MPAGVGAGAPIPIGTASGERLAIIAVPGHPNGVALTQAGAIVVTHGNPNGMVVFDSP